jgi:general secretion pathway protein H
MSQTGSSRAPLPASAGFTLFEVLVVMIIIAMTAVAVASLYRGPSAGTQLKAAAMTIASRLRDLRAAAMATGSERVALIDVNHRVVRFGGDIQPLSLNQTIDVAVVSAESERASPGAAGVRFFPNGSSTGATIQLKSERQAYEIRVNWLTGRVSGRAAD